MVEKLERGFAPEEDMLLMIGSPVVCALAFTYCANAARFAGVGHVKVLIWSRRLRNRRGDYMVIDVPISDLTE